MREDTEKRWAIIVDDRPQQAAAIAQVLEQWGLPSRDFIDPNEALQFARHHAGSVVFALFDVNLGERSGVDYARIFREEQLSHIIALVTAYKDRIPKAALQELRKLGVSIYEKPIDLDSLRKEVLDVWCQATPRDAAVKSTADCSPVDHTWTRRIAIALAVTISIAIGILFVRRILPTVGPAITRAPRSNFIGSHGTNKKLIVFVHGVLGDMNSTWLNPDTGAYWPKMMRDDPEFQDFDVFVYGYNSPAFSQASDIEQIAERLGQQLNDRNFFSSYEEIDIVTHSMGGVVTKRMLNDLYTPSESAKLQRVHCVIYIAVPSNGADAAVLASWLSRNPQFKSMDPKRAADFLASVETDWARLLRERTTSAPFPRSFSAYETVPMNGVTVVPELYTSQISDGTIMPFDYNHSDIVKPPDNNSDVYRWVAARIHESSSMQTNNDSKQ